MLIRYSMIDTFLQCPNKFFNNYVKERTEEEGKSSALEFGSAMHLALKAHFEGEDPFVTFDMYWNGVKSANIEYGRESWDDLRIMATETFIPNFLRMHSKKFSDVKTEETLTMPFLGSHTFQGTFDLCGQYEGKLTLTDWKTSAREYNSFKIMRNPQMYCYAMLYYHKYGILPEQVMYKVFIKSEKRIQTQKHILTQEKMASMISNVEAVCMQMIEMVEKKKFYCNWNSCYCTTPKECFIE